MKTQIYPDEKVNCRNHLYMAQNAAKIAPPVKTMLRLFRHRITNT
jgi:hypothetical protein